ncbi:MAG: hypothetical protein QNL21_03725, partial [Flavobacteriales bacterium]
MNTLFKKALPHLIAILSFLLISVAFYSPAISGKKLKQGDINQWRGMSKEVLDHRYSEDEEPLWTNSMFGGMPAYQISVNDLGNLVKSVDKVYRLWLPSPISTLFKAMLGFYILLMCMKVRPAIGAVGAISFGLSSFFILYLGAGHATKMNAITYIAPMLGGILFAFRRHALKGSLITAFFLCLHLGANHFQMTYYALFLLGIVGIGELIRKVIMKESNEIPKIVGFLLLGGALGALPNCTLLSTTAEYGEYSTRGSSELTLKPQTEGLTSTTEEGLGKDYILEYSMSKAEWLGAYVPNVKGGKTNLLVNVPEAKAELSKSAQQFLGQNQILSYWGEQRGTAGAFYFGALMCFLAICGLFLLKDSIRWPLLIVAVIAILASWKIGDVPDLFLNNVPLWNKFRDTKMMLMLLMIIIPFLGTLFLNQYLQNAELREKSKKFFYLVGGAFVLFNIVLLTSPGSIFDFFSSAEKEAFLGLKESKEGKEMLNQIVKGRQGIFTADVMRSFIIFILGLGVLLAVYFQSKMAQYAAYALGFIFIVDMWSVDHRYFDIKEGFQTARQNRVPFLAQNVEKQILAKEKSGISEFDSKLKTATNLYKEKTGDTRSNDSKKLQRQLEVLHQNTNFRVLNLGNPWSDARTSYYHKSIGGYHGAKLKIYQELIDFNLGDETKEILNQLQTSGRITGEFPMLSMLNTKYMIGNPDGEVIPFYGGFGNAWFINEIKTVADTDAEMNAMTGLNPDSTAVIQSKFTDGLSPNYSSAGSIDLIDYQPNKLTYTTNNSEAAFAVFSEIYYPAGWNAYIDGQLSEHVKANYILRGLNIPAGAKE